MESDCHHILSGTALREQEWVKERDEEWAKREKLAEQMGREPTDDEWDEYFYRGKTLYGRYKL